MNEFSRRSIFKASAGLAAAALFPSIRAAQAIPAATRHGSIKDVEHIVILMQENRSFDHYFGCLRGVRGFTDRFPAPLPNGRPVWHQTDGDGREILPFHLDSKSTSALSLHSLDHSWSGTHAALNGGRHDGWIAAKSALCMGAFNRSDIPFHYALADAFTICDAYFASHPGSTRPNRLYMMTGQIDPLGLAGGPVTEQPGPDAVFNWDTYPEMLERAGISWLIYQGTDADGPYPAHVGDFPSCYNELTAFPRYRKDEALHFRALEKRTLRALAQDVSQGTLPQISWIMPPYLCSEHPSRSPLDGAAFISGVIDALTANPESWSKTALFIAYDENDGFFDHVIPPFPSKSPDHTTVTTEWDFDPKQGLAYGLGVRVPMLVVSPWSRGGRVNSQTFDHSSIIQFAEQRFGVINPHISPWRRTVCGDLSSAFDFSSPNKSIIQLPKTEVAAILPDLPTPVAPEIGALPAQERGQKASCPLPYQLRADARLDGSGRTLWIDFANQGSVGSCFTVFSADQAFEPRCYTLAAGKTLSGRWDFETAGTPYHLSVYGANGFFRLFRGLAHDGGDVSRAFPHIECIPVKGLDALQLTLYNRTRYTVALAITDCRYGRATKQVSIIPRGTRLIEWPVAESGNWYDIAVSMIYDARYLCRLAGHLENGQISITDPAI